MRRFMVYFMENEELTSNILALVKEWNVEENKPQYRFVNFDSDSLLPEVFPTPAKALDWLDWAFGDDSWVNIL